VIRFRWFHSTPAKLEWNQRNPSVLPPNYRNKEAAMSFGKGALLWLIGIPLPIILLIAVFMHH
jgi:hypothetical protein